MSHGGLSVSQTCMLLLFITPLSFCLLTYIYGHDIQSMGPGPVDARVTESRNCTRASVIGSLGGSQGMRGGTGSE